jgi:Na+/H+ antiporter NhaD/arsenite permease-like protein
MSMGLTAFNDNTAIAYLATLIPYWSKACQYALITGVISGGGLTVIANAPNPAGFVILSEHFNGSASSWKLFLNALIPALIFYLVFSLFSPVFREVS